MGVAFVAHCLLNQNSKVGDGAHCAGVHSPVIDALRAKGWRIEQMPCPELAFTGLNRFWAVKEQLDTPAYRQHCRRLAGVVADMMSVHAQQGEDIVIVGVDGSPSMGVELTAASDEWGGRPDKPRDEDYPVTAGAGIFTETLLQLVGERVDVTVVGIGHDLLDYDEARELAKVRGAVGDAG
jgi:predicted secreted protein